MKRFEIMVGATLGKNLGSSMPKQSNDNQKRLATCTFLCLVKLSFQNTVFI